VSERRQDCEHCKDLRLWALMDGRDQQEKATGQGPVAKVLYSKVLRLTADHLRCAELGLSRARTRSLRGRLGTDSRANTSVLTFSMTQFPVL
jgi:hypothetical protein